MNNNCLECAENHSRKYDFINDTNCYINCDFYYRPEAINKKINVARKMVSLLSSN